MHPRLEAELNNDEPKCKNCKHWTPERPTIGHCAINGFYETFLHTTSAVRTYTTDLSVCSAWEGK